VAYPRRQFDVGLAAVDRLPEGLLGLAHPVLDRVAVLPQLLGGPGAFTTFPGEAFAASRSRLEQADSTLTYYNQVDRGGHFAAWEQPEPFAAEGRAAFRRLRAPQNPEPRR
jgi:pimeloyl-ACP methyl ester carboxylesterase